MSNITEVYSCTFVPNKIPLFVDPHVTVDDSMGSEAYLIEVNPNHQQVKSANFLGQNTVDLLKQYGIQNPTLIYKGERPKF